MSAKWSFNQLRPGDKIREPIQGEFFSTEAISNSVDALVRESIQNSLDAALEPGTETVRVRFLLGTQDNAVPAKKIRVYFAGAWPHYEAPGNGLRNVPGPNEPCQFLVFEDFGTTGLQGDTTQWHDKLGEKNPFFYFFRAEGRSSKSEEDRGRWGLGKFAFPRMSRVSSFCGLTVRADDGRRLLMAQAVLKSHEVGGIYYSPDGCFGQQGTNGLVLPCEDQSFINKFCEDFGLQRKTEPGLSVVIPWLWEEDVSKDSVVESVVRGYFQPIVTGSLAVTVETSKERVDIDHETLLETVENLGAGTAVQLLPLVRLAAWAAEQKPADILRLNPVGNERPRWSDDLIPNEQIKPLSEALQNGNRLALRAPIIVREKGRQPRDSHIDFFLVRDGDESGRPTFIREGIIIADVRAPRSRGVRSIVIVEDKPIAGLLGDAENPAHTQWQKDSSNFKGKYLYGSSYLDFVTRIVWSFVQCLSQQEKEEDRTLLLDIFSLPDLGEEEPVTAEPKDKKEPGKKVVPPNVVVEPGKKRFRIQRMPGGFSILPGEQKLSPGFRLNIRVAYDVRRGSPLKRYDPADFKLGKGDVHFNPAPVGLVILSCAENRMEVEVNDPDFALTVLGFDVKRDLFVSVRPQEVDNDSTT